jgi:predicted MPP superfamily phosphohydrolase
MKIETRIESLDWFSGRENLRILQLSDLHLKGTSRILSQLWKIIETAKPDLIVMTGDYFDTPWGAKQFVNFLGDLASQFKVYWITGNHDDWLGRKWIEKMITTPGVTSVNCHDALFTSPRGFRYQFTTWPRHLLDPAPLPDSTNRIVLTHDPRVVEPEQIRSCSLVLAGHLHGGQFVLWKNQSGTFVPGIWFYRYCGDRFQFGSSTLIVSRGLGDTLPLRFRCPHEVVLIEIR